MKTVLVTGAGGNASQNFLRSIHGFRLVGVDMSPYHLATSRLDARYLIGRSDSPDYVDELNAIIDVEGVDFLHAQPDVEVECISQNREAIHAQTFLPPHESIVLCHNKYQTNQRLKEKGIPVPKSFLVERIEDIPDMLSEFRTEKAWLRAVRGAGSRAALPVKTKRQAEEWIHYWRANRSLESKDFMLSEFLPGKEYAFQSLWMHGALVCSAARERMEYMFGNIMPSGQSSSPSIARSVHNQAVNKTAVRAIMATGHQDGIYCVDLKEDADGVPCVTEINIGRFFTTSNFFTEAGCNMPQIYLELGMGGEIPQMPRYDCVPENLYWVRGVDREPRMFREEEFVASYVKEHA